MMILTGRVVCSLSRGLVWQFLDATASLLQTFHRLVKIVSPTRTSLNIFGITGNKYSHLMASFSLVEWGMLHCTVYNNHFYTIWNQAVFDDNETWASWIGTETDSKTGCNSTTLTGGILYSVEGQGIIPNVVRWLLQYFYNSRKLFMFADSALSICSFYMPLLIGINWQWYTHFITLHIDTTISHLYLWW